MAHKLNPSNVMLAALVGGFAAGFLPLQLACASAGLRPGIGTAIAVNVILPLVALALGIFSREVWPMLPAGILIPVGFFLGSMARVEPRFWVWTANLAVRVSHPILIWLIVGTVGYHSLAHLRWVDATLNASMILSGMGPVDPLPSDAAKLFASAYAILSGVVILSTSALLLAPLLHRLMHHFHMAADKS